MSARSEYKRQFQYSYEDGVTSIFAKLTIGASGAVSSAKGLGLTSIVKNAGTGDYTITLDRKYYALLGVRSNVINASPSGVAFSVVGEAVQSAGTIAIITNSAGVAANPASGTVILIEIILKDSKVNRTLP